MDGNSTKLLNEGFHSFDRICLHVGLLRSELECFTRAGIEFQMVTIEGLGGLSIAGELHFLPGPGIPQGAGLAPLAKDSHVLDCSALLLSRNEEGTVSAEFIEAGILVLGPIGKGTDDSLLALEEHFVDRSRDRAAGLNAPATTPVEDKIGEAKFSDQAVQAFQDRVGVISGPGQPRIKAHRMVPAFPALRMLLDRVVGDFKDFRAALQAYGISRIDMLETNSVNGCEIPAFFRVTEDFFPIALEDGEVAEVVEDVLPFFPLVSIEAQHLAHIQGRFQAGA